MYRPLSWGDDLRSAQRPRGLVEQFNPGIKSHLIEDEDFSGDKPGCETDHQCGEREPSATRDGGYRAVRRVAAAENPIAHGAMFVRSSVQCRPAHGFVRVAKGACIGRGWSLVYFHGRILARPTVRRHVA